MSHLVFILPSHALAMPFADQMSLITGVFLASVLRKSRYPDIRATRIRAFGTLTPLQLETRFWRQNYLDLV